MSRRVHSPPSKLHKTGGDRRATGRRHHCAEIAGSTGNSERDRTLDNDRRGIDSTRFANDAGTLEYWLDAERLLG